MADPMPPDAPVMIAVLRGWGLVSDGLELELVYALAKLLTTAPTRAVFVMHGQVRAGFVVLKSRRDTDEGDCIVFL